MRQILAVVLAVLLSSLPVYAQQVRVSGGQITADLSTTDRTTLGNMDADLTTIIGHVDTLEALLTTINGNVDGLEGYVDGLELLLTTQNGYLDGLEGLLTTIDADTGAMVLHLESIESATEAMADDIDTLLTRIVADAQRGNPTLETGPQGMISFDDVSPFTVAEGATVQMRGSAKGDLYTYIRDAAGNERGANVTANNELLVELGAGTASIGTLGANSGVDIGDVTLTAGSASIGTLGANSGVDIGDVTLTAGSNMVGFAAVAASATTTDSALECSIVSAASTNSTNCKTAAGNFYGIDVLNTTTTTYYLRLYNTASAPTCSSATGFIRSIPIPPGVAAGATGGIVRISPVPVGYSTGISYCLTGGASSTDNTNAATGIYGAIVYK